MPPVFHPRGMDIDDFFANHELRDPQVLLDEIAAAFPLTEGRVLLALVHQPARAQKLLALDELSPLPPDIDEEHRGRSDLLYERVLRLPIPPRSDTSASILVTVIVRSGTNGWGEEEIRRPRAGATATTTRPPSTATSSSSRRTAGARCGRSPVVTSQPWWRREHHPWRAHPGRAPWWT